VFDEVFWLEEDRTENICDDPCQCWMCFENKNGYSRLTEEVYVPLLFGDDGHVLDQDLAFRIPNSRGRDMTMKMMLRRMTDDLEDEIVEVSGITTYVGLNYCELVRRMCEYPILKTNGFRANVDDRRFVEASQLIYAERCGSGSISLNVRSVSNVHMGRTMIALVPFTVGGGETSDIYMPALVTLVSRDTSAHTFRVSGACVAHLQTSVIGASGIEMVESNRYMRTAGDVVMVTSFPGPTGLRASATNMPPFMICNYLSGVPQSIRFLQVTYRVSRWVSDQLLTLIGILTSDAPERIIQELTHQGFINRSGSHALVSDHITDFSDAIHDLLNPNRRDALHEGYSDGWGHSSVTPSTSSEGLMFEMTIDDHATVHEDAPPAA